VLRAFEKELNLNVICPNISGLMGAYGAALYAKSLKLEKSTTITPQELKLFHHEVKNFNCQICNNHCLLSVNTFGSNHNKFISGNRCEKPLMKKVTNEQSNLYEYIRQKLMSYEPQKGTKGKIGIPLALNMYELFPFWYRFFTELGFEVVHSGFSNEKLYTLGQHTIPSDTVCYPAKLVHGHIAKLINDEIKTIFYPCMSYNIDEMKGDNHFNCPIVAYYPQTIENNVKAISSVQFLSFFIGIHHPKTFEQKMYEYLKDYHISKKEIANAAKLAYEEYENYLQDIRNQASKIIENARKNNQQIIVLAGRPYHVDPQINHGIDKLINGFGVAVITEESISHLVPKFKVGVLNQWTYHARLYAAAKYCTTQKDMNLVQLVSFGCGLDAVTTDECKTILENHNKIYTQIKIDEITNLGAVKIRLRSLFAALEQQEEK
ncbi:MAG: 2-hydroxyacyl-CoA dehydratase, partial [Anaeroplasmataceae bacterium]|nr:2-hydroxyacyl-CoA dehydratase [Anaeroplasmataceae bacterium]